MIILWLLFLFFLDTEDLNFWSQRKEDLIKFFRLQFIQKYI